MEYKSWTYLYPPRPESVVTADMLPYYQKRGWWAQYKKNGTNSLVVVSPKGEVDFWTRHGTRHKAWNCNAYLKSYILDVVPRRSWTILVAELLHNKTQSIKDTLYFHDVIVYRNEHLVGTTFAMRQVLLDGVLPLGNAAESHSHWVLTHGVWRAKNMTKDFLKTFKSIKDTKVDEGLVVKNPEGKLVWCLKPGVNSSWQVKVRYPAKNYQF